MTAAPRNEVDRLLDDAEQSADRAANKLRVIAAIVLLCTVFLVGLTVPPDDRLIQAQVLGGKITVAIWLVVGLAGMWLNRIGVRHPLVGYAQATFDALLVSTNLYFGFVIGELAGNFWPIFPAVWLLPVLVAGTALRWRPGLTIYSGVLVVALLIGMAIVAGTVDEQERATQVTTTVRLFGWPPNSVRLVMLSLLVTAICFVTIRGRALILRAAGEAQQREALGRHLPRQVLPLILDPALAELRRGSKRELAVMFVDIRGSTAIAERLDPATFAGLLTGFRRIVDDTVSAHGGVVDKFIGDGALILFGVLPIERDAARRAIECARMLLERMAAFERRHPEVRIGIGIHFGPVFVGVVGEGERVEFTALGEPVNIAARIEKATKELACRLLVTQAALDAAGARPADFGLAARGEIRLEGSRATQLVFGEA
ncbi:adenylate/guanylate cyclase domain-containing protein [Desertibaculum subflavum]|uniref:adenylate/guanylate cyclase domain-containing protein n=1 Tax=Desertibaculum subflavum TaxID=2268458 RepID=UPI000E66075E